MNRQDHSPLTTSTLSNVTHATDEIVGKALKYASQINVNTLKLKTLKALYQNALAHRRLRTLGIELE